MDATWAAAVTGSFAILMLLIERGRRENVRDHGYVAEKLDALKGDIKEVQNDLKTDIKDIDSDLAVIEYKLDTHMSDTELHSELLLKKPIKVKQK